MNNGFPITELDLINDKLQDARAGVASPEPKPVITALEFKGKIYKLNNVQDLACLQEHLHNYASLFR